MIRTQSLVKAVSIWLLLIPLVILICLLALLNPASAGPSSDCEPPFTVEILDDTNDFVPGDGCCSDASGYCSLRANADARR